MPTTTKLIAAEYKNMEITKEKYEYAQARIDALLPQIDENTPMNDPLMVELMIVTDVVEAYENEHCHIPRQQHQQLIKRLQR